MKPFRSEREFRPRWKRIQIIWADLRLGRVVNATEFSRQLEVSTKTIHRDLEFMRDSLGFDFVYDPSRFGYRATASGSCPFCAPPITVLGQYSFSRRF